MITLNMKNLLLYSLEQNQNYTPEQSQVQDIQLVVSMKTRLRQLLSKQAEIFEMFSIYAGFGWFIWLISPFWDVFGSSPTYKTMQIIYAHESVWGIIVLAPTLFQAWALRLDDQALRRNASLVMAGMWAFIAAMFIISNWQSTGTIMYPGLVLGNLFTLWRLTLGPQIIRRWRRDGS